MELFDSHAHLMDVRFHGEVDHIIHQAAQNDVKYITTVGYNEETSQLAVK